MSDYNLGTARGVIEIDYRGDGATRASRDLRGAGASADDASERMGKAGTKMMVGGAAIAGGLALAVKSAADFEKQLSNVAAVSGASDAEMEQLRNKSLQLGKDTQFSAAESASAIEELVKAGISVQDVMAGAADSTVALAAAGEVSMPEAASIASNAMNQFGLAAEEMPKVADAIAGAANASAIDVKDFGYSLGQVGAVANLAGAKFEDTATAIALMGNAGIKGSDAGTSLKSMLMNLQPTTEKQIGLFDQLGLRTFDAQGAMEGLREMGIKPMGKSYDDVRASIEGYVDTEGLAERGTEGFKKRVDDLMVATGAMKNSFYDANGELKSMSEVSGILATSLKGMSQEQKQAALETLFGSDGIRAAAILAKNGAEGFDKMAESMGKVTAAEVAEKRMDNLQGALEMLKGSLETLMIQVGTPLLKGLRSIVEGFTGVLNVVLELPGPVLEAATTFLALLSAGLLIVGGFLKLRALIISMRAGMLLFSGPILLIIAAIAALVAAFVYFYKTNAKFRAFVQKIGAILKESIGKAIEFIVPLLKKAGEFLVTVFQKALPYLKQFGEFILGAFNGAKSGAGGFMPVLKQVWSAIMSLVPPVKDLFASLVGLGKALLERLQPAFTFIISVVKILAKVFTGTILPLLMRVGKIFFDVFVKVAGNSIKALLGIVKGVLNVISGVIKVFTGLLTGNWSKAWEGVKQILSGVIQIIVSYIKGLVSNAGALIKGLGQLLLAGVKAIPGLLKGAGSLFLAAGKFLMQMFVDGIKSAAGLIAGIAGNVWDFVKGLLNGAIGKINAALEFTINPPGPGSVSINPPDIPQLATGAVITAPTLSWVGEGTDSEAVVPLRELWKQMERVFMAGRVSSEIPERGRSNRDTSSETVQGPKGDTTFIIHNPVPERSGRSVQRVLRDTIEQEGWSRG